MTYKEVIKIVKDNALKLEYELDRSLEEQKRQDIALDMVIRALEKRIPVKSERTEKPMRVFDTTTNYQCPLCGYLLLEYDEDYCSCCGQAIDWGKV